MDTNFASLGRRFYGLTVIGREKREDGGWDWICDCVCGQTCKMPEHRVRTALSCGHALFRFQKAALRAMGVTPKQHKSGRRIDAAGYVHVKAPDGHSRDARGEILEHRLVMEQQLGRQLDGFEEVHHKNAVRSDNRPDNLELWAVGRQPRGARVQDLVEFAQWVLSRYGRL